MTDLFKKSFRLCDKYPCPADYIKFYSKTCLKQPLKKRLGFKDDNRLMRRSKVLQNAPTEHSAVLLTCIKLLYGFKTFVMSNFEWPLKTGFNVLHHIRPYLAIILLYFQRMKQH